MTETGELLAAQAIATLRARYFRLADIKDWAGFAALFAPDAELSFPDDVPGLVLRGPDAIASGVADGLGNSVSVHHGHMGELAWTGEDSAEGIWAMEDIVWFGNVSARPGHRLHGYGHYHDRYVRTNGVWLFQRVELRRLHVDVSKLAEAAG